MPENSLYMSHGTAQLIADMNPPDVLKAHTGTQIRFISLKYRRASLALIANSDSKSSQCQDPIRFFQPPQVVSTAPLMTCEICKDIDSSSMKSSDAKGGTGYIESNPSSGGNGLEGN